MFVFRYVVKEKDCMPIAGFDSKRDAEEYAEMITYSFEEYSVHDQKDSLSPDHELLGMAYKLLKEAMKLIRHEKAEPF